MPVFTSSTDIANQALRFLGETRIVDLDADPEASDTTLSALQDAYPLAVEEFCRDAKLDLDVSFVDLVLLVEDPTTEWMGAFYLPPECKLFNRFVGEPFPVSKETRWKRRKQAMPSGSAVDVADLTLAAETIVEVDSTTGLYDGAVVALAAIGGTTELNGTVIVSDLDTDAKTFKPKSLTTGEYIDSSLYTPYTTGGTVTPQAHTRLLANLTEASIEMIVLPDVSQWPSDKCVAVAHKLAYLAGTAIAGLDNQDLVDAQELKYHQAKNRAIGNEKKEVFHGQRPQSRLMRARGAARPLNQFPDSQ